MMRWFARALLVGGVGYAIARWQGGRQQARLHQKLKGAVGNDGTSSQSFEGTLDALADNLSVMRQQARDDEERDVSLERIRHAERLSTLGKLASSIAHELGNPINVISGYASMLSSGELTPEAAASAGKAITEQSQRMSAIIAQVLQYSSARPTRREIIEIRTLVKKALSFVRMTAKKNRVRLRLQGESDWASAEIDPGKLLQVLINLLTNGIQAMPNGGTLTVGVKRRHIEHPKDPRAVPGEYLCISVRDEGVGISAEEQALIFEPFFTTKSDDEGTGLGLWISQGIAREHNGFIEVESELERGSCFSICLLTEGENHARPNPPRG
jgi:two-component system NtrC family sensor kinase